MAEFESPAVVVQDSRKASEPLSRVTAKFLLHGFVATGIVLGFLILSLALSSPYFYLRWGGVINYDLALFLEAGAFLAFGVLKGLVDRRIGRAFWSVSKNSLLADMFIRGPTALAISWAFAIFVASPVISALFPDLVWAGDLYRVGALVLFVLLITPWNGLVAVATIRWQFGNLDEVETGTTTTLGTCPFCKAAYHYSPSAIVEGQVRCQNCGKSFRLLAEGPSVG
ncbi:MAG: hypothetical protein C4K49_11115 [Candidatus Thorarchaeota archaeon]|nr:MAG: hypothetical protein C4K49_11115 [Candidatus Thorarchaeota archaeon]